MKIYKKKLEKLYIFCTEQICIEQKKLPKKYIRT